MHKFSDFDYKNARNDWNPAEITFIPQISREILIFITVHEMPCIVIPRLLILLLLLLLLLLTDFCV